MFRSRRHRRSSDVNVLCEGPTYLALMDQPSILLIVLDSVRKDRLSCFGHERPTTPFLDELSESATSFTQVISPSPWTGTSHASIFSGGYPFDHGVYGRSPDLGTDVPVIAEALSQAGYRTIGFSNSPYTNVEKGFDRGFDRYHDITTLPKVFGRMFEPNWDYLRFVPRYFLRDDDISWYQAERLKREITEIREPVFAFINFNSAHVPYDPPSPQRERFEAYYDEWETVDLQTARTLATDGGYPYMAGEIDASNTEWDLVKCWYDGELAYQDAIIGDLLARLRQANLLDEMMIVVMADHGEHLGENGLALHQFSLREPLINVPVILKTPGQTRSRTVQELRSTIDVTATILNAADASDRFEHRGHGLATGSAHESVYAEWGRPTERLLEKMRGLGADMSWVDRGLRAIRTEEYKLVEDTRGDLELYRIAEGERTIDDPETRERLYRKLTDQYGASKAYQQQSTTDVQSGV